MIFKLIMKKVIYLFAFLLMAAQQRYINIFIFNERI